jgi:EmrB/QacA subfamily drug resistance transporter
MVLAGLILLFGRIADKGAVRKIFISGFAVFTLASFFCGISATLTMLLVFRIVQGVGGAMLAAAAPMICVKYMPREKLGFSLSVITLGSSVGYALGPALGGLLTELLSWHWIFLINIPIGLLAIPLALHVVPRDKEHEKITVDFAGGLALFAAIVFGVFALEMSGTPENGMIAVFAGLACIASLAVFIIVELRTKLPIIDVRIFKSLRFDSVFISFLLFNIAYAGTFYLLPFFMNLILGFSPGISGMYLLVPSIITAATCLIFGRLSDSEGKRPFAVAACISITLYNAIMWFISPENGSWILIPVVILMGLSWGFAGGPMAGRIVEQAPKSHMGIASSVMALSTYLGIGVGTAFFASVFSFASGAPGKEFSLLSLTEFAGGWSTAVILSVIISVIALILSAIIKDPKTSKDKNL